MYIQIYTHMYVERERTCEKQCESCIRETIFVEMSQGRLTVFKWRGRC